MQGPGLGEVSRMEVKGWPQQQGGKEWETQGQQQQQPQGKQDGWSTQEQQQDGSWAQQQGQQQDSQWSQQQQQSGKQDGWSQPQQQQQDSQWSQQQPQGQQQPQNQQAGKDNKTWPQQNQYQAQQPPQQDNQSWSQQGYPQKLNEQKPEEPVEVGTVPGGWPQSQSQQSQTQEEEANVPGGWPQQQQQQQQPLQKPLQPLQQPLQPIQPLQPQKQQPQQLQQPLQPQQPQQQQKQLQPIIQGQNYPAGETSQPPFTPAPTESTAFTPASSVTQTQSPPTQDEQQEPNPLDSLEQFYADSIHRFIDMIQAEVAATTDEAKLRVFTEFMEREYFLRGERYPNALGEPHSRHSSYGRLPGMSFGDKDKEKEKAAKVVEQKSPPPQPEQIIVPVPAGTVEAGAPPSPWEQNKSPTSFPEVVVQQEVHKPEPPLSPAPLVIKKVEVAETYKPFRPNSRPDNTKSPAGGYKPFNTGSPPPNPSSSSSEGKFVFGGGENKYVPFRGTETVVLPLKQEPQDGPYKPYKQTNNQNGRTASPGPDYVPFNPKRASIVGVGTPAPGHSKRNSVGGYPQPARADTMQSPISPSGGAHPFGPLKSSKTSAEGYQPYTPDAGRYNSSGGSSAVFSTPDVDEHVNKKKESYFPPVPETHQRPAATPIPGALQALTAVLPVNRAPRVKSSKVMDDVRKTIEAIGEDFSFIDEINRQYNESAKKRRRKLDEERRARAEEHEQYTSDLYADQQIGYADIKEMENDFRLKEARKEEKEEEQEYEVYCSGVFQKVYDRLQEGIKGLMDKYFDIMKDVSTAVAGKDRWTTEGSVELTELLEGLLELRKYIETRHDKVQVAVLERDKRFKKTVIQPLYAGGNIAKMKSMEKHFEESEKKAYAPFLFCHYLMLVADSV